MNDNRIVIKGKDWFPIELKEFCELMSYDAKDEKTDGGDGKEKGSQDYQDTTQPDYLGLTAAKYFPVSSKKVCPFNMGVYLTQKNNGSGLILRTTQYVGVLPLIERKKRELEKNYPIIKVISRFKGLSPIDMLNVVLRGDDYYENPGILKTHSYSRTDWLELGNSGGKKINVKIQNCVFGIIEGTEKIDLSKDEKDDLGLADMVGVLEVIDFVNKAKAVCKKSLKKQSDRVEENLNCKVKGKILIQKQIKNNVARGQIQKVYCSYNKLSPNTIENQILKYCLYVCSRLKIGDSMSEEIRFCMNALSGVPIIKCTVSDFHGLKNNGAYRLYKDALIAAQKVLNRYSLVYKDEAGEKDEADVRKSDVEVSSYKISPFFIDMNLLFEYYCRALIRNAINELEKNNHPEIHLSLRKPAQKHLLFETDADYLSKYFEGDYDPEETDSSDKGLRRYFMPIYIPDIIVEYSTSGLKNKKVAAVIDAKYSDVEEKWKEKRARTHQIMFYMQAIKCNIAGLIGMAESNKSEGFSGFKEIYHNAISSPVKTADNTNSKKLCFIPITYGDTGKEDTNEAAISESVREFLEALLKEIDGLEKTENEKRELISRLEDWRSYYSKKLSKSNIKNDNRTEYTKNEAILTETIDLLKEDKL